MNFFKKMAAALMIAAISFTGCKEEPVKVTGVSLDESALTLVEGQTVTLVAAVAPGDAENKAVKWASSDPAVAAVDGGMVTAVAEGTATITVTTDDGGFTAGCIVTVTATAVTGVSLDESTLVLTEGQSAALVATVAPDDAANKAVTWQSDKPDVAAVDANGTVTAVKAGTATVTVTTTDGNKTATCAVTVTAATVSVTGVTLNKPALTLAPGASETLKATVVPDEATDKTVTWAVTEGDAVTVSDAGVVTAVRAGTATVTVTTVDGGFTDECTVTVKEPAMTMTTRISGTVEFLLAGTGTAVIDWGDGAMDEEIGLIENMSRISHTYTGSSTHSITIDGQNITQMICAFADLTSLNVNNNTALTFLDCSENQLVSLDVTKNTALTHLSCYGNELTSLDVSNNTVLTLLQCHENQLTSLKVNNNTALEWLNCDDNRLTSLNVSNCTALNTLYCSDNQLTNLNVSNCFVLSTLQCVNNQLTSLDMNTNTVLYSFFCRGNQFTAEGLNALFGTLHNNADIFGKAIYIGSNPGSDWCDWSITRDKGWTMYH